MARNPVQFQKGLGMAEFMAALRHRGAMPFGTRGHALAGRLRLSGMRRKRTRHLRPAAAFPVQALPGADLGKAGTVFHQSKTPLTKWFLAMHLMTSAKNDIAALELARQLDVKWDTAWLIKQKLMEAMRERNEGYSLSGDIEIDDAYLGGEKPEDGPRRGQQGPFRHRRRDA